MSKLHIHECEADIECDECVNKAEWTISTTDDFLDLCAPCLKALHAILANMFAAKRETHASRADMSVDPGDGSNYWDA